MNKLRLEKLKVKIDCVNTVFEEAREHLIQKIKSNPNEYKRVIKDLLVEGFIKLLEDNVNIVCKKGDYDLVKGLVDQAKEEFIDKLKKETKKFKTFSFNVTVDNKFFLPDST